MRLKVVNNHSVCYPQHILSVYDCVPTGLIIIDHRIISKNVLPANNDYW